MQSFPSLPFCLHLLRHLKAYGASNDSWRCIFAQYALPFVKTPYFILEGAYDSWQVRSRMNKILTAVVACFFQLCDPLSHGLFALRHLQLNNILQLGCGADGQNMSKCSPAQLTAFQDYGQVMRSTIDSVLQVRAM